MVRRLLHDLGDSSMVALPARTRVFLIVIRRLSRSISDHVSPSSSPRRIPDTAARCHTAPSRSFDVAEMNKPNSYGSHALISFERFEGLTEIAIGFCAIRSQRTASLKARFNTLAIFETVFAVISVSTTFDRPRAPCACKSLNIFSVRRTVRAF